MSCNLETQAAGVCVSHKHTHNCCLCVFPTNTHTTAVCVFPTHTHTCCMCAVSLLWQKRKTGKNRDVSCVSVLQASAVYPETHRGLAFRGWALMVFGWKMVEFQPFLLKLIRTSTISTYTTRIQHISTHFDTFRHICNTFQTISTQFQHNFN